MDSFWNRLPRPFFAAAPMADVTDPAFRRLLAACGKPDVLWTEFVSADGLYHTREMKRMADAENPLMRDLAFTPDEHPIVAQLFGRDPETMRYAAELVARLGFDGIDLNMGCPDKSIEKQGAGAAMMKAPQDALAVIEAAREGSEAGKPGGIPVSVKTRVGYHREILDEWLPALLSARPATVTLHLRTRKEMSEVPAHWEYMKKAVAIRDAVAPGTPLIGNGDVMTRAEGEAKAREYGADGIMIGRGMFGNPWVFAGRTPADTPLAEKLDALVELAHDFEALRPAKSFHILKKHIKAFVTGFEGAAELRAQLMLAENANDLAAAMGAYEK